MEKASTPLSPARFRPQHSLTLSPMHLLASLPNEILFRIFAHVAPNDLLSLQSVCTTLWGVLEGNETVWRVYANRRVKFYAKCSAGAGKDAKETLFKGVKLHQSWLNPLVAPHVVRGYYKPVKHLRIDCERGIFANASDNVIEVWNMPDDQNGSQHAPIKHRSIHTHLITVRSFDMHSGRIVYPSGLHWRDVQLYDIATDKSLATWSGEGVIQGNLDAVAMNSQCVIGGAFNAVMWDIETHKPLCQFPTQRRGTVNCIQICEKEQVVGLSYRGKKVRIFDIRSGQRVFTVAGHGHLVHAIRWNGEVLATCSKDKTIRVWEPRMDFTQRACFTGHTDSVHSLQLDSWRIISGGRDNEIRLWDLETDSPDALTVIKSDEPVFSLVADETRLITGSLLLRCYDFSKPKKPKSFPKTLMEKVLMLGAACFDHDLHGFS